MGFEDNSKNVKKALEDGIVDGLKDIGKIGKGESQLRSPVKTGKLRRAHAYRTNKKEKHVDIGVTKEADYGIVVHEGSSKQRSQPFLRDAIMQNISKFEGIISKHLNRKLR